MGNAWEFFLLPFLVLQWFPICVLPLQGGTWHAGKVLPGIKGQNIIPLKLINWFLIKDAFKGRSWSKRGKVKIKEASFKMGSGSPKGGLSGTYHSPKLTNLIRKRVPSDASIASCPPTCSHWRTTTVLFSFLLKSNKNWPSLCFLGLSYGLPQFACPKFQFLYYSQISSFCW